MRPTAGPFELEYGGDCTRLGPFEVSPMGLSQPGVLDPSLRCFWLHAHQDEAGPGGSYHRARWHFSRPRHSLRTRTTRGPSRLTVRATQSPPGLRSHSPSPAPGGTERLRWTGTRPGGEITVTPGSPLERDRSQVRVSRTAGPPVRRPRPRTVTTWSPSPAGPHSQRRQSIVGEQAR